MATAALTGIGNYITIFEASAPWGAGSDGDPCRSYQVGSNVVNRARFSMKVSSSDTAITQVIDNIANYGFVFNAHSNYVITKVEMAGANTNTGYGGVVRGPQTAEG